MRIMLEAGIACTIVAVASLAVMRAFGWPYWAALTGADTCFTIANFLGRCWPLVPVMALMAVISALMWRHTWRRRKRRRAAALLGAKSRALRERLVRTMRRERRPSRVLRPHPVPS